MKIKHQELEILAENPFVNCQLHRKPYADVLTEIIATFNDGFVLALNSKWGTGKTTFVRMWKQDLENGGYKTLYLNAWENDLMTDPTVAILGELKKLIGIKDNPKYKKVMEGASVFVKNILPSLTKALLSKYINSEVLLDAIENSTKSATEIIEEEIDEYSKKEKEIQNFKKELIDFIKSESPDKPVIFIIDELDRCRPDYAVQVLEKIKHFFSVEGVTFILSIDKSQLINSVKGFYGSDSIDADEYLRRFIDLEYKLPNPEVKNYCRYLYRYFGFESFFSGRRIWSDDSSESSSFIEFSVKLCTDSNLTLRQIEKLFAHSRIAVESFSNNQRVIPVLFFSIIFLRNHYEEVYNKIVSLKYNDLEDFILEIIQVLRLKKKKVGIDVNYVLTLLLYFYNQYYIFSNYGENLLFDKDGNIKVNFQFLFQDDLLRYIKHYEKIYSDFDFLGRLINKIELYDNIFLD